MSTIYTYFEGRPGGEADGDLIRLWAESWQRHGWTPRILTPTYIRRHKLFKHTLREKHWQLAMRVTGGGWFSSFDVMNFGLSPRNLPPRRLLGAPCSISGDDSVVLMHATKKWVPKCDLWAGYFMVYGGKNWCEFPLVRFSKSAILNVLGEAVPKWQAVTHCGRPL